MSNQPVMNISGKLFILCCIVISLSCRAGGKPEDIVKINLLVVNKNEYRERGRDIGAAYRKHLGRHFPAMTLAEVKGLFEDEAKIEIEAVAMVP